MSILFWAFLFAAQDLWFLQRVYAASRRPDPTPWQRQHVRDGYALLGGMVVAQAVALIAMGRMS